MSVHLGDIQYNSTSCTSCRSWSFLPDKLSGLTFYCAHLRLLVPARRGWARDEIWEGWCKVRKGWAGVRSDRSGERWVKVRWGWAGVKSDRGTGKVRRGGLSEIWQGWGKVG